METLYTGKYLGNSTESINNFIYFSETTSLQKLSLSSHTVLVLILVLWMLTLDGEILTWNMVIMKALNKHRRTF